MKLTAPGFRRVTTEGIGADPAFASSYEQQRAGLAEMNAAPKAKGIRTSSDNNAHWCQVQRRKIQQLLDDSPELTGAEADRGHAAVAALGDNLAGLKRLLDGLKQALAERATRRAAKDAARHEATKAALRSAA